MPNPDAPEDKARPNDPDVRIVMTEMIFDIDSGTQLRLKRCEHCKTLVLPDDAQDHVNWHAQLTAGVKLAGLGFGGLPVPTL